VWLHTVSQKNCPILIILSLLQTEINYDQVYSKIYHQTTNLLVHYLVKWTRMYWPTLLSWFRNQNCKSQTSHIECNRYGQNQHCQFTSCTRSVILSMHICSMSSSPLVRDLDCLEAAGWVQESLAFLDAAVQLLHVHGVVCWCTVWLSCWNTKSLPETLRIAGSSMTSLWRGEAASNKSVRDITRISCFVTTMKLPRALQIYSTVFVKKRMRLHFSR